MRISDWSSDVCSSDLVPDDIEHALVGVRPVLVRRGRDDDEVRLVREGQIVLDIEREAELRHHDARVGCHDAEIEVGHAVIGTIQSERLAREAEFERREAVLDDHGDGLHGAPRRWQDSFALWPSCHWWQSEHNRSVPAMVLLLAFSALAVAAIVATFVGLARDGYRAMPT